MTSSGNAWEWVDTCSSGPQRTTRSTPRGIRRGRLVLPTATATSRHSTPNEDGNRSLAADAFSPATGWLCKSRV